MLGGWKLNLPPGWPAPPPGWRPATGWRPDPSWPAPPPGWSLWVPAQAEPPRRRRAALTLLSTTLVFAAVTLLVPQARAAGPGRRPDLRPAVSAPAPAATPASTPTPSPTAIPSPAQTSPTRVRPTPRPSPLPPRAYRDCAALNAVYPHGLGLPGAVDRTPAGNRQPPVTGFGRSTSLFRPNARLDTDGDHIACEHP